MPSWKKLVVSGSDAALSSLFVTNAVTASVFSGSFTGSMFGTASYAFTSSLTQLTTFLGLGLDFEYPVAIGGITPNTPATLQSYSTFLFNPSRQTLTQSGSLIVTGSFRAVGSSSLTGSLNITGSINSNTIRVNTTTEQAIILQTSAPYTSTALTITSSIDAAYSSSTGVSDPINPILVYLRGFTNTSRNQTAAGIALATTSNAGTNNAIATIHVVQPTFNDYASDLAFQTRNSAGTVAEKMRLASNGDLTLGSGSAAVLRITGSVNATQGYTGSLFGTASYVTGSIFNTNNPAFTASHAVSWSGLIEPAPASTYLLLWNGTDISQSAVRDTGTQIRSDRQISVNAGGLQVLSGGITSSNGLIVSGGDVQITGSFSVTGSTIINTQQNATINTGTSVVATLPTSSMYAAFFDYIARSGSATQNMRAGTVMAVWNTIGTIEYTDNSTPDIGNTSGLTLAVVGNGNNVELRATVTTDSWNVKTFVRSI